jgi:hypothetical protein
MSARIEVVPGGFLSLEHAGSPGGAASGELPAAQEDARPAGNLPSFYLTLQEKQAPM